MTTNTQDVYTPPNDAPPMRIDKVLVGQTALITGASKGLGQGMAIGFAMAGADVLINYNGDEAGALETKRRVEALGRRAEIFKANVVREDEVKAIVIKLELSGKIIILFSMTKSGLYILPH